MKRLIFNIIILIIMITVPSLPYKKQYDPCLFDEDKINLEVEYDESADTLVIVKGSGYIKRYASMNDLNNINVSEIKIIGKTPYKEISNYRIRKSEKRRFFIKGEFVKGNKIPEILTLKVSDWAPLDSDVRLLETVMWHKYNLSLWFTYFGVIIIIHSIYILCKPIFKGSDS